MSEGTRKERPPRRTEAGETRAADFAEDERFESGASRYADYLQTVEGRLRLDLAWLNLLEFISQTIPANTGETERRALDVGGGTGALALRLAAEGWSVDVLDSSAAMLALASTAARRAGHSSHVSLHEGDASLLGEARYLREGRSLLRPGLYLDLPGLGCHLFEITPG